VRSGRDVGVAVDEATASHHRFAPPVPRGTVSRTLYQLEGCPYCEKVADRMDELGVDYDTVWVEGLHSERDEVKRVSGQRAVPVLVDEEAGVTMAESERILEYVARSYA
jgi:glutaredoxin